MKKLARVLILLSTLAMGAPAYAVNGLSFTVGRWPNTDVWGGRVAAVWYWDTKLCSDCWVYLTGYWDASFAHWESHKARVRGDKLYVWAFSPVIRLMANMPENCPVRPFIEGGVGGSYVTSTRFANRNLSSNFLFEDRVGAGVAITKHLELAVHYRHYSNANTVRPNEGLDLYTGTVAVRF